MSVNGQFLGMAAQIMRCGGLSDSARITVLELSLCAEFNQHPSLRDLSRLRHLEKSTIQRHIGEALKLGIITKKRLGENNRIRYVLRPIQLMKLNSLARKEQIKPWSESLVSVGRKNFRLLKNVLMRPEDWRFFNQAKDYFNYLGRKKEISPVKESKEEAAFASWFFGKMLKDHGGGNLKAAIDYFSQHYGQQREKYTVKGFYKSLKNGKYPMLGQKISAPRGDRL